MILRHYGMLAPEAEPVDGEVLSVLTKFSEAFKQQVPGQSIMAMPLIKATPLEQLWKL